MNISEILEKANNHLQSLENRLIPVLEILKPESIEYA